MADAPDTLAGLADGQLAAEDGPWLDQLALYGRAGQAAVDMLAAQRAGHGSAAWHSRVTLHQLLARIADGGVTVGQGVLDAFLERTLKASDAWAGLGGDNQLTPTTTLGTAQDHDPALMVDDDRDSYYWTDAPPQPGDAVGVDLGTTQAVGTVRITMGGPDGDVASDDYLHDAVLEYATQDSGWQQVATYHDRKTITAVLPVGTTARYVRLRALSGQDSAVAVRSFRVDAPGSATPTATAPPAAAGTDADDVVDGTLDTPTARRPRRARVRP
ncbi:discoidin domain-containing protein [Streptacidiphilus monticola]